jgi:hypothetical protein
LNSNDIKTSQTIQKTKEEILATKPRNTFWIAIEKVLEGFVKIRGFCVQNVKKCHLVAKMLQNYLDDCSIFATFAPSFTGQSVQFI